MILFKKPKYTVVSPPAKKKDIPDGLWMKCEDCGELVYKKEWEENLKTCPKCDYPSKLSVWERLAITLDESAEFVEYDPYIEPVDFLEFKDIKSYKTRIEEAKEKTKLKDAIITGEGFIGGHRVVIGILAFEFMGGSLGCVMGEKITRTIETAISSSLPLVIISSSGGARMQEGILSLMQMAKTSSAIAKLNKAGLLYISVLTNPTTAGVMASFASLGDILIAENRALIGFAGPRVIEQTIRQKLPSGFQRAEFLLEHGLVDMVVTRKELKPTLINLLDLFLK